MTGLVDKAQDGTLTVEQRGVLLAVIECLARLHPDVNRDDFRRGAAAHYWNVLTDCSSAAMARRAEALNQLGPNDFVPKNPQAAARLRELIFQWALPQKPLSAPLYVYYGGKDPFIDAPWVKASLERACAMGGVVTIVYEPDGGHNPAGAVEMIDWMKDRFDAKVPVNDC
jgi:pimeloyl-ACP methyl ester carboxylesterase